MVHAQQQYVFGGRQPQHRGAQQRTRCQIEGAQGIFGGKSPGPGLALLGWQRAQVHHLHGLYRGGVDDLPRLVAFGLEGGAQRFMTEHQRLEGTLECRQLECALQSQSGGDVVGGGARLELVDEPEALLSEGERQHAGARNGAHGWRLERGVEVGGVDAPSEGCEGGGLEDGA